MDTSMENVLFVHNKDNGTYMKYAHCPSTNLYTYVIEEGK